MALFAVGFIAIGTLTPGAAIFDIGWRLALCGIGFGLFQSPNSKDIISAAPVERSGGASGMQATSRLFGQAVGGTLAALLIALLQPFDMSLLMLVAAGIALASALVSAIGLIGRPTPHSPFPRYIP
jgi:DHA2 family multidrug resistance protein-like MFS transporter